MIEYTAQVIVLRHCATLINHHHHHQQQHARWPRINPCTPACVSRVAEWLEWLTMSATSCVSEVCSLQVSSVVWYARFSRDCIGLLEDVPVFRPCRETVLCVCVFPHSKTKTTWAINTNYGTHTLYEIRISKLKVTRLLMWIHRSIYDAELDTGRVDPWVTKFRQTGHTYRRNRNNVAIRPSVCMSFCLSVPGP